jgi:hypothetical protein
MVFIKVIILEMKLKNLLIVRLIGRTVDYMWVYYICLAISSRVLQNLILYSVYLDWLFPIWLYLLISGVVIYKWSYVVIWHICYITYLCCLIKCFHFFFSLTPHFQILLLSCFMMAKDNLVHRTMHIQMGFCSIGSASSFKEATVHTCCWFNPVLLKLFGIADYCIWEPIIRLQSVIEIMIKLWTLLIIMLLTWTAHFMSERN